MNLKVIDGFSNFPLLKSSLLEAHSLAKKTEMMRVMFSFLITRHIDRNAYKIYLFSFLFLSRQRLFLYQIILNYLPLLFLNVYSPVLTHLKCPT